MNVDHKDWSIRTYNEIGSRKQSTVAELREEFAKQYEHDVSHGYLERAEVDLIEEGRRKFDREVKPERDRRRRALINGATWVLVTLEGGLLCDADPVLDMVFPVGDGTDKVLRDWTADDWITSATERLKNAAEVKAKADEFDKLAMRIVELLRARGILTTGEAVAAIKAKISSDAGAA